MKYSEFKDCLKMEKMKSFFDRIYGSGTISFFYCIMGFVIFLIGGGLILFFAPAVEKSGWAEIIWFGWFILVLFLFSLFFITSYFSCRPVHGKDKYRYVKEKSFITVFYLLVVLFLPFILMIYITNLLAKVLNLKKLGEHVIDSIISLLIWCATFIISGTLFLITDSLLISFLETFCSAFYAVLDDKAIIYYTVFLCIVLSNKVSEKYFFFVSMIEQEDEQKIVRHEMALLWNYTILGITLGLKPLNITNSVCDVLVDALFYSSTVISLLGKITEGKRKLFFEEKKQVSAIVEDVDVTADNNVGDTNEHKKFSQKYWNYYLVLEKEFKEIIEFVALRKENLETCSNRIISLLLNVGAEFDFLCKMVCGFSSDSRKNIADYAKVLLKQNKNLREVEIEVIDSELAILPFQNWDKKHAADLGWWNAYTSVKHNRIDNVTKGNLENLLNAMGALYYLEMYYMKKLADKEENPEVIDVPVSCSDFFKIKGWVTRYLCIGYNTYIDYDSSL